MIPDLIEAYRRRYPHAGSDEIRAHPLAAARLRRLRWYAIVATAITLPFAVLGAVTVVQWIVG
ncbi:hypothetical protein GCM10023322_41340 [Rugosimonospora acidiphila]|uniref:Uncharacterized protein n=1 Tax=Rugosimonospora acidiphila TaxID=556531 RepID=A0ABP9RZR1_9ACTN